MARPAVTKSQDPRKDKVTKSRKTRVENKIAEAKEAQEAKEAAARGRAAHAREAKNNPKPAKSKFNAEEVEFAQAVGQRLRDAATEQRLSSGDIAPTIRQHPSAITQIYSGKKRPNAFMMVQLAERLGLSISYLLTGEEAEPVPIVTESTVTMATRENKDIEMCFDCGSKSKPLACADPVKPGHQFMSCKDCYARSQSVRPEEAEPIVAWNAQQRRAKFEFEKTCVAQACAGFHPDSPATDVQRSVLLALEAARFLSD